MTESLKKEEIADLNLNRNIYIEASAGTGKTYTIQQIVARMIQLGTALNRILLVTYTEKAAGELKDRIRNKIDEVLTTGILIPDTDSKLTDEQLGYFETAKRDIDGAQIFTIHSFCQKTLRTYAYDAWRPFDMQLIDDKAVKNLIARKIRDDWPTNPDYRNLLKGCEDDSDDASDSDQGNPLDKTLEDIETILVSAIPKYFLDHEGKEHPGIIALVEPEEPPKDFDGLMKIPEFRKVMNVLVKYPTCKPSKTGKATIGQLVDVLRSWTAPNSLFDGRSYNAKSIDDLGWDLELYNAYKQLLTIKDVMFKEYKTQYPALLKKYQLNLFLCHELPKLYQEWRKEKADHQYESYQDMIHVVHQAVALDEGSTLVDQLRKDYRYAIIDEFQDTNRLQWDIFRTIFMGDEKHPLKDNEHSLFVVGDPKQSIYAFQGADIAVYRDAIATIGDGRKLDTNYRSTNEMIEACNALFDSETGSKFFTTAELTFSKSNCPQKAKAKTFYDGIETNPVWISRENISEYDFATFAAEKIVDCCSQNSDGRTQLQIFDKNNPGEHRNVRFSDFAILLRTKTEFLPMENALKKLGIPFVHYKDAKLFDSRECMQWIALFKAIDADDFAAYNRRLLNEVLMTDFFLPSDDAFIIEDSKPNTDSESTRSKPNKFYSVSSRYYDDPTCPERLLLSKYHALARKYRWAELLECIYRNSSIETRTARDLSKLQSLAKFQQIGNYCIEYLYAHRCTIQDLVKHLDNLQKAEEGTSDQDGNLVARNTDFNAVQLMTIHASKGLEFPIVIGCAGFKTYFDRAKGPFAYHDSIESSDPSPSVVRQSFKKMGFDKKSKEAQKLEDIEEWKRLFYVAYTRASSLLILPRYGKICDAFLKESIDSFARQKEHCTCFDDWEPPKIKRQIELKDQVQSILKACNENHLEEADRDESIQALQSQIGSKSLYQHSYSSLAAKDEHQKVALSHIVSDATGRMTDIAGETDESDNPQSTLESQFILESKVDPQDCHFSVLLKDGYRTGETNAIDEDYPRGRQLGNAIHEVFEKIDFAKARMSFEQFKNDPDVFRLIDQTYSKFGLPIAQHDNWLLTTLQLVWHTLNAKLPEIPEIDALDGAKATRTADDFTLTKTGFSLKDASNDGNHFPEVEFMLKGDADAGHSGESDYFFKGFIDLLFVRTIRGQNKYCILDWKSDRMPDTEYTNPGALRGKVDREYSVQRVLYSYCLMQWLKQFYAQNEGESEADYNERLFREHFGGIYYAFIRGCAADTSNGIYAQTWKSYEELNKCYRKLKGLMYKQAKKEEHGND